MGSLGGRLREAPVRVGGDLLCVESPAQRPAGRGPSGFSPPPSLSPVSRRGTGPSSFAPSVWG